MLDEEKAKRITPEDLRHSRLTEWAETGNLPGAAYLAGHLRITTISHYAKPGRRAAERLLGLGAAASGGNAGGLSLGAGATPLSGSDAQKQKPRLLTGVSASCEGGDSNPHRSYPTSTSS